MSVHRGGGCLVPGGSGPGGGVCSWGGGHLVPVGSAPGGVPGPRRVGIPACTEADPPPGETATAADGTHPTGMHSCLLYTLFYSNERL